MRAHGFSVSVPTHAPIDTHTPHRWALECGGREGEGGGGSDVLAVVAHVRRVLLVDEEERRLVRSVLHVGGVHSLLRDVGDGDGRGGALAKAAHALAALRGLGCAVQVGRHQAVVVLGPGDLKKR